MDMDQSLRDTLNQLVTLQAQQLNAINTIAASSVNRGPAPPQFNNSYMNSAPNYMPPMMPFSQGAQQRFDKYAGQLGNTASFSEMFFANKSKISVEQRGAQAADLGAKASNAAIAGGGVVASAAADIGFMALAPGLMSGLAAGAVGGAVVGGLFDIGLQQNAQHQAYNKYLQRESYRFINPLNSTNERDIAGFGQNDRFKAAGFLRHFNTEAKISDQETTMLMEKFTEGNLLKGTKDLEGFKDKIKSLTKYVKQSALLLNESFEDITGLMSDMQKAGMDVKNIDYMSAKSKVIGAFTGMSAGEAMRYTTGTATNMVQGTNFQSGVQQERLGDTLLYMGGLYDKAMAQKDMNPKMKETFATISNMGGIQNASTVMAGVQNRMLSDTINANAAINFFDYDKDTNAWAFNKSSFDAFLKGGGKMSDLSQAATNKLNDPNVGIAGKNAWMRNRESYLRNSLDNDQSNSLVERLLGARKAGSSNPSIRDANLSYADQISLLMGDNSLEGKLYGQLLDYQKADGGELLRKSKAMTFQTNLLANINSSRPGFGYEVKNTWEKFKDTVGDAFVPVGEAMTRASTKVSDWWYGTEAKWDRSAIDKPFSAESVRGDSKALIDNVMKGVQDGLKEAKANGFNVKDDILKMFSASDSDMSDWKNKVIDYKREVYKSIDDMGADVKKYADTIKKATEAYGVSETTVVGMLRYGGKNMGMGTESINAITQEIGAKAYQADDNARISAVTKRLGGLNTDYGGNQELANAALATSKEAVDAALAKFGINAADLRKSGNQNQLQNVKYSQIKQFFGGSDRGAIDAFSKWKDLGNVTTFDETKKQGLASHMDVVEAIRASAGALGNKDENALATLFAIENGGSDASNRNTDGSIDYGPAQLNNRGFVTGDIGKTFNIPGRGDVTVTSENWKKDRQLNVFLGSKYFTEQMATAKGNASLAYALYNSGGNLTFGKGKPTVNIMELVRKRLSNSGVKDADMDEAIRKMSPEEISELLQTAGGSGGKIAQNMTRYANEYVSGILPGKDPNVVTREVAQDATGKMLDAEQLKKYREGLSVGAQWGTDTSFTFEGMKDLYNTLPAKYRPTTGNLFPDSESEGIRDASAGGSGWGRSLLDAAHSYVTGGKKEYEEALYTGLAKGWGINYDGSTTALDSVTLKMRTESERIDTMMTEYDRAATPEEKAKTQWAQLGTNERAGLIQIRRASSILRNEKKVIDPNKYTTVQDKEEYKRIETSYFGSNKYNPAYKEGKGGYEGYMTWLNTSGKMSYKLPSGATVDIKQGGTLGDIRKQLVENLATIETETIETRKSAEDMIASKGLFTTEEATGEESARWTKVIQDALSGKDPKAQEELYKLQKEMGANLEPEPIPSADGAAITISQPGKKRAAFNKVNKALDLMYKLKGADISKIKGGIEGIDALGTKLQQFGQMGGVLMGAITGKEDSARDFQERFGKDVSENILDLDQGGATRMTNAGTQEMVNELSKLKGNDKGMEDFIGRMKEVAPSTVTDETVKKLKEAFANKENDQKGLQDVIYGIITEWGAAVAAATDPTETIKQGAKTSKELQDSLKKLTDDAAVTIKIIGEAQEKINKEKQSTWWNKITGTSGVTKG